MFRVHRNQNVFSFFAQERRNSLKNFAQKLNFRLRDSETEAKGLRARKKSKKRVENGDAVQ